MAYTLKDVTGLMVVYKTIDIAKVAYESFRQFYPKVELIIIDNSGGDKCTKSLEGLVKKDKNMKLIKNKNNEGHGSSLHQGFGLAQTDLVYMFDSDTKVMVDGFLEKMFKVMKKDTYGVGKVIRTDMAGRNVPHEWDGEILKFMLFSSGLLNIKEYKKYYKFTRFGLVNFKAMVDIHNKGDEHKLVHFPITNYVRHFAGGTRAKYGDCEDIVEGFGARSKGNMQGDLD